MSAVETLAPGDRADGDPEDTLARVRDGLAAIDARIAAADGGAVTPDDRASLVALVLSVDEMLRELEGRSDGAATREIRRRGRRTLRGRRWLHRRRVPRLEPGEDAGVDVAEVVTEDPSETATEVGTGGASETDAQGAAEAPPIDIDREYDQDLAARAAELRAELDERAGRILVLTGKGRGRPIPRAAGLLAFGRSAAPTAALQAGAATRTVGLPAALRDRRAATILAGRALTAIGVAVALFLAFEFGLTGALEARDQRSLLARFRQGIITHHLDDPRHGLTPGGPIALLDIPAIHVNQVVVEGTTPQLLKSGPGHVRAAPLPGEFGNAIIAGHRTTYGAPFRNLDRLRKGEPIEVTTGQGAFSYIVTLVYHVKTGQPDVFNGSADSRITLVSADPPLTAKGRVVVVGLLQGDPVAVAQRPPVPVGNGELGLASDPAGGALALVWGQVLLLAIYLSRRLYRRWNHSVTYLLATPVLVALTLLLFENLDRLFPGTL